jgi:hypothetical protein
MSAGATGIDFEELVEMLVKSAQLHIERGDSIPSEANPGDTDTTPLASNGN